MKIIPFSLLLFCFPGCSYWWPYQQLLAGEVKSCAASSGREELPHLLPAAPEPGLWIAGSAGAHWKA